MKFVATTYANFLQFPKLKKKKSFCGNYMRKYGTYTYMDPSYHWFHRHVLSFLPRERFRGISIVDILNKISFFMLTSCWEINSLISQSTKTGSEKLKKSKRNLTGASDEFINLQLFCNFNQEKAKIWMLWIALL